MNNEIKLAAERAYPVDKVLREAFEKGAIWQSKQQTDNSIHNLLEEVKKYYKTHSKEEINKLWKEIELEGHLGPTCTEYKKFLNDK